jgi:hypothetical protein
VHVEPTIGGAAAGLVASRAVALEDVARPAKVVRVQVDGERDDVALIDALLTQESHAGSLMLFEPSALRLAVLARANPAAVGISSIAGLLRPCDAEDERGVVVRFAADGPIVVSAPVAPGLYERIGVTSFGELALGEVVRSTGPAVLALDGERQRMVQGDVQLRVVRDGPRVIDVQRAMEVAARAGAYVTP